MPFFSADDGELSENKNPFNSPTSEPESVRNFFFIWMQKHSVFALKILYFYWKNKCFKKLWKNIFGLVLYCTILLSTFNRKDIEFLFSILLWICDIHFKHNLFEVIIFRKKWFLKTVSFPFEKCYFNNPDGSSINRSRNTV